MANDGKTNFDEPLLPHGVLCELEGIMRANKVKHPLDDWRTRDSITQHVRHAHAHLWDFIEGDTMENHLGNAAIRLMMALEIRRIQNDK
jgi:hypothetical protein